jgi:serine/threonine protein kinase
MVQLHRPRDENVTVELQAATGRAKSVDTDGQPMYSPIVIGRVLRDRYVLVQKLGSGGKGEVFKALDRYRAHLPEAQQYVAIKILHGSMVNRDEQLAHLRREFYCTQKLSHRNIINVFELDRDGDVDFFTMECLQGERLSRLIARLQPLPMSRPQAWAIIREIGRGLDYAHAQGVVHADLKPHNIMITDSGEVRIFDFGSSSISAQRTAPDPVRPKGAFASVTPAYASCELLEGRAPDPRDDIYAFACLSYELLEGAHPFQRRRSTEARDFAIVPKRPMGLSHRQWRTLTMGLSWHRAGRSIAARAWIDKVGAARCAGPLPCVRDIAATPKDSGPKSWFRPAALFAVLLVAVGVWVKSSGNTPGASNSSAAALATSIVSPSAAAVTTPPQTPQAPQIPQSQPVAANAMSHDVEGSTVRAAPKFPVVSADNLTAHFGDHFAEIRVHRSASSDSATPFVWWTEAASAKPGVDYVAQGKAIQAFPKGKSSTSFFVKLVPTASRTQPEVFYIAIAATGHGPVPGPIERTAVWLPTKNDRS